MANGSMEVQYTCAAIQGFPSSIRIQERRYRVPVIKITHVIEERSSLQTKSRNEKALKNVTFKTQRNGKTLEMAERRTCMKCNSNVNQNVPCVDNCLSLRLPLEVELNVLGVVDQGMIDRGEMAKIRRVGSRKRNSAPEISIETLPVQPQKSRPRSFSTNSDLSTLLKRGSLQSTTLCSTEL